jgi:predicted CoA-binding protein
MPKIKEAASEFLANKRVAVTGVSRQPGSHASNAVYQRLRERGYEVFAVNPNAEEVEGDRCYPDLRSILGGVDAVVIATRPEFAEATMRECADLAIKNVWMHRGPGAIACSWPTLQSSTARPANSIASGHTLAMPRPSTASDRSAPTIVPASQVTAVTTRGRRRR